MSKCFIIRRFKLVPWVFFLALVFSDGIAIGQSAKQKKTKILLLAIETLPPSTADYFYGINDPKRKSELSEVQSKLVKFFPNQIFLQYPLASQSKMDSMYNRFLNGTHQSEPDEFEQFGFKIAQQLQLKKLTCVNSFTTFDFIGENPHVKENNRIDLDSERDSLENVFKDEIYHKIHDLSVKDFLLYINSKTVLERDIQSYMKYIAVVRKEQYYVGAQDYIYWYMVNLRTYIDILRSIQLTDKAVLVVFDHQSISILKSLFEKNPDFEIISLAEVLK